MAQRGEKRIAVTVSIGASVAGTGDTQASLVARADGLMYCSKLQGRNKVTSATGSPDGG